MNERKLKCSICGNEYTTTAPNSKYCCLSCSELARRQRRKLWESDNADYQKMYARMRRRAMRKA